MLNILLDFDGTLFDTDTAHESAYNSVFNQNNLGKLTSYEEIKGIRTKDVFARYVDNDLAGRLAQKKTDHYLENVENIKSLVDFSLLQACKEKSNRLFIVSGGSKISIYSLLKFHHQIHLFDGIVTSEDYNQSKPHPEPFLKCIKIFNIKGEVIGVEDSTAGIQSLKSANILAIGVHNECVRDISDIYYDDINHFLKSYILNE